MPEPRDKPGSQDKSAPPPPRFRGPQRARAARILAVQAVYQNDLTGAAVETVLKEFLQHRIGDDSIVPGRLSPRDHQLFTDLVRGVGGATAELDAAITAALAPERKSERLEVLLRAILRCGALELRDRPEVPVAVIINEYVDIAHAFYGGKEPGLVNAVLDRLARTLREPGA